MGRTAIALLREHARRVKVPVPNTAASSSDVKVALMFSHLNELVEDLNLHKAWQINTREATHVGTGVEDAGSIYTIAGAGFVNILPDTIFNRTSNIRVHFAATPEEWQQRKTVSGAIGPDYWARLRANKLLFNPPIPVGETIAFEYRSRYFVVDVALAEKEYASADDDTFLVPDAMVLTWLKWRWKDEFGLNYSEEKIAYEAQLQVFSARDNGPRTICMSDRNPSPHAGVVVPIGSWDL